MTDKNGHKVNTTVRMKHKERERERSFTTRQAKIIAHLKTVVGAVDRVKHR